MCNGVCSGEKTPGHCVECGLVCLRGGCMSPRVYSALDLWILVEFSLLISTSCFSFDPGDRVRITCLGWLSGRIWVLTRAPKVFGLKYFFFVCVRSSNVYFWISYFLNFPLLCFWKRICLNSTQKTLEILIQQLLCILRRSEASRIKKNKKKSKALFIYPPVHI